MIKWCLRLYAKSHSYYEDMRTSGFLKLPSGRTLSDCKNFCYPKSGWRTNHLLQMKIHFQQLKLGKRAAVGGLLFDEVRIKEGLVFDPSTWELVGFTDLEESVTDEMINVACTSSRSKKDGKPVSVAEDKLTTHVLQFYFKSLFSTFEYPCAFFLTRSITSLMLNRVFWQGVSMLHGVGFMTLFTCCDGASANRSFMVMNGVTSDNSTGYNNFSGRPVFFLSDPPHLLKKLRNKCLQQW